MLHYQQSYLLLTSVCLVPLAVCTWWSTAIVRCATWWSRSKHRQNREISLADAVKYEANSKQQQDAVVSRGAHAMEFLFDLHVVLLLFRSRRSKWCFNLWRSLIIRLPGKVPGSLKSAASRCYLSCTWFCYCFDLKLHWVCIIMISWSFNVQSAATCFCFLFACTFAFHTIKLLDLDDCWSRRNTWCFSLAVFDNAFTRKSTRHPEISNR